MSAASPPLVTQQQQQQQPSSPPPTKAAQQPKQHAPRAPGSPPPSASSTSARALEDAFHARQSRVLLVSGLPAAQSTQHALRAYIAARTGADGSSNVTLGIVGVFAHQQEPDDDGEAVAARGASWWCFFHEHELARDAHRILNEASTARPADTVKVSLALEEDLAPLEKLVAMPLVRSPRHEPAQELFPSYTNAPHPTDESHTPSSPASSLHDGGTPSSATVRSQRTPSLSFSSTSSSGLSTTHSTPASGPPADLGPRASFTTAGWDPKAKPFVPSEAAWSGANGHAANGSGGVADAWAYEGPHEMELSSLGLMGTGGGTGVSFRQGDWICPSDTCSFHNFSRNEQCMICATAKPVSTSSRTLHSNTMATTPARPPPEITTPVPQRLPSHATASSAAGAGLLPCSPSTPQPGAINGQHATPAGHLTRSSPAALASHHQLPSRPLLNSVSLPDFASGIGGAQGGAGGVGGGGSRERKTSTLSSPGVQMTPLPTPSGAAAYSPYINGAGWQHAVASATPSPLAPRLAHLQSTSTSYFPPLAPAPALSGSPAGGSRGRSVTHSPSLLDLTAGLGALGLRDVAGVHGHRATVSLGGNGGGDGERFAPIVNSGNTGPMTIQQGDWACGTCGFVNWRRRRVCLKCFPFADGNELPGGVNLAAGALLAAQLAQAPAGHAPSSTLISSAASSPAAFQATPSAPQPSSHAGAGRFISGGTFHPPPTSDNGPALGLGLGLGLPSGRGGQDDAPGTYDVFGLVASPSGKNASSHAHLPSDQQQQQPYWQPAPRQSRRIVPLSPIGAEVRSLAAGHRPSAIESGAGAGAGSEV